MPAERVPMRDVREIIRLKFSAQVATREIARRLGMAPSTVRETLKRLAMAGLAWPLPEGLSDTELEAKLYAFRGSKRGHRLHAEPDWQAVHRELKRKHVTLQIVWDEYIAAQPGGYSYSRFCELFRGFEKTLSPTMRQSHAAGERLFVDYAGDGVPVLIDARTGELRKAQIFVAVLGASSFTFAHASWTQTLPDWIDAHVRALAATCERVCQRARMRTCARALLRRVRSGRVQGVMGVRAGPRSGRAGSARNLMARACAAVCGLRAAHVGSGRAAAGLVLLCRILADCLRICRSFGELPPASSFPRRPPRRPLGAHLPCCPSPGATPPAASRRAGSESGPVDRITGSQDGPLGRSFADRPCHCSCAAIFRLSLPPPQQQQEQPARAGRQLFSVTLAACLWSGPCGQSVPAPCWAAA